MTRRIISLATLCLLLSTPCGAKPPVAVTQTAAQRAAALRLQIFDSVWRTVRDGHYDPKMNGVNWIAVRAKYRPQAAQAKDESTFYAVLNSMLGELKQSHLGAIPPAAIAAATGIKGNETSSGETGDTGITAEWIENLPVVVRVKPDSAGQEAGIKPGMTITAINGKPLLPALEKVLAASPHRYAGEERVTVWATLGSLLSGSVGKPLPITVTDVMGNEQKMTVVPRKSTAEMVTFGALPPLATEFEKRTLDSGIGYIRFSIFLLPLSDRIKEAIHEFARNGAPGIIIDLRGNRGGVGIMASGIAGTLTTRQLNLGTMKTRAATLAFTAFPQEPVYSGKVVILTDEGSISTSEIMAAGLQETKRATVIGRPTAGMVLPSQIITLPDGGRLQYVFADFRTPKGILLEGRGATPDIPVTLTRTILSATPDGDPILDTAMQFLKAKDVTNP